MRRTQCNNNVDEHVRIQDEQTQEMISNRAKDVKVDSYMRDNRSYPPRRCNDESENLV